MNPPSADQVGWVEKNSRTQQPYAWTVRCLDHPPEDDEDWERLARSDCPTEAACEECGEFLS